VSGAGCLDLGRAARGRSSSSSEENEEMDRRCFFFGGGTGASLRAEEEVDRPRMNFGDELDTFRDENNHSIIALCFKGKRCSMYLVMIEQRFRGASDFYRLVISSD